MSGRWRCIRRARRRRGDQTGQLTLVVGRTRASGPVDGLGVVSLVVSERQTWSGSSLVPYLRLDVSLQPTAVGGAVVDAHGKVVGVRSEEHTSELQSRQYLVCRLLLEKKKKKMKQTR